MRSTGRVEMPLTHRPRLSYGDLTMCTGEELFKLLVSADEIGPAIVKNIGWVCTSSDKAIECGEKGIC